MCFLLRVFDPHPLCTRPRIASRVVVSAVIGYLSATVSAQTASRSRGAANRREVLSGQRGSRVVPCRGAYGRILKDAMGEIGVHVNLRSGTIYSVYDSNYPLFSVQSLDVRHRTEQRRGFTGLIRQSVTEVSFYGLSKAGRSGRILDAVRLLRKGQETHVGRSGRSSPLGLRPVRPAMLSVMRTPERGLDAVDAAARIREENFRVPIPNQLCGLSYFSKRTLRIRTE